MSGPSHWLEDTARRADLQDADTLMIPPDCSVGAAWQTALTHLKLPPRRLAEVVAQRFRLPVADLPSADPSAVRLVPETLARSHQACPVKEDYGKVMVAMVDPTEIRAEQALEFASGRGVIFEVAPPGAVEEAILFFYSPDQISAQLLIGLEPVGGLEESIRLVEEVVVEERHTEEALGAGPVVTARSLEEGGVPPPELTAFRALLDHRDGMVVVTGPTGSGKTTALYAALQEVAEEGVNVMTVEDPIEYELPGLTQIQVEPKQGVTFASALRAILRQDPDVIFVGELPDGGTAAPARLFLNRIEAALQRSGAGSI